MGHIRIYRKIYLHIYIYTNIFRHSGTEIIRRMEKKTENWLYD